MWLFSTMRTTRLIGILIVLVAIPIGVYTLSPLFIETSIDEPLPDNVLSSIEKVQDTTLISDKTDEMKKKLDTLFEQIDNELEKTDDKRAVLNSLLVEMDDMIKNAGIVKDDLIKQVEEKYGEMVTEELLDDTMTEEMIKSYKGTFVGVGDGIHDVKGDVKVLKLDDGSKIVRFENFKSANGPALHVYLSTDRSDNDYIDLGSLRATQGNQNYEISGDIDLEKYDNVLVWCQPFRVLFGHAELTIDN